MTAVTAPGIRAREEQPREPWRTPDGAIDPVKVPCPCCGELPWCWQESARLRAEVQAAPEFVMGAAMYGGGWSQ